jgi:DNA-binding transcriptional LysR family regulator
MLETGYRRAGLALSIISLALDQDLAACFPLVEPAAVLPVDSRVFGVLTRAAEKLRIAQSAISQQIKTLEEELEVKLLLRTKRSVKLTAAGQAFLRKANDILNRVEQSRGEARRAARGETGTLSIGFFKTGSFLFLPELIHAYRTHYPSVRIDLHEQTPSEQLDSLEHGHGRIDVGFTHPLPKAQAARFVQERVYRDCVVAVLPDRHELACLRKISLEKLADENWVLVSRSTAPD